MTAAPATSPRAGEFDLEPPRPKGMRQRTYQARLREMRRLEAEAMMAFMGTLGEGYPEESLEDRFGCHGAWVNGAAFLSHTEKAARDTYLPSCGNTAEAAGRWSIRHCG